MINKRTMMTWIVSIVFFLVALSFVIQLVDQAGQPIVLDPEQKLELPPPPKSMYQMGETTKPKTSSTDPATDE